MLVIHFSILKPFVQTDDTCQWRSQFVADVCNKLALGDTSQLGIFFRGAELFFGKLATRDVANENRQRLSSQS